jgi:hypothetical protein
VTAWPASRTVEAVWLRRVHTGASAGTEDPQTRREAARLGIPTAADRVVQAALKLVLEPTFEADFLPCSYGSRPKRRAQDAIAEIRWGPRL